MLNLIPDQLPGDGRLLLAFSGGPDSACLLHLLLQRECRRKLLCIHVDHQLDPDSGARAEQAAAQAGRLGADCRIVSVEVKPAGGPEASARHARYRALGDAMAHGDVLLTAHHADDQVESVLLRLMRGAGPGGLAGIARQRRFGPGWLVRPLLDWPRRQIEHYVEQNGLQTVRDPANREPAFDRNFLRHEVLPLLRQRWPGLDESVSRSARLCAGAADMIQRMAAQDLTAALHGPMCLELQSLVSLPAYRIAEVVRGWCIERGISPPPGRQLEHFVDQVLGAAGDRQPELRWDAAVIRRWRDRLWLDRPTPPPTHWHLPWDGRRPLTLPDELGSLELSGAEGEALELEVGSGKSGERLRLPGRAHHHRVKQLMAERGIPPWQRLWWPRVRHGGQLVAVGDRWLDDGFARLLEEREQRLVWRSDLPRA